MISKDNQLIEEIVRIEQTIQNVVRQLQYVKYQLSREFEEKPTASYYPPSSTAAAATTTINSPHHRKWKNYDYNNSSGATANGNTSSGPSSSSSSSDHKGALTIDLESISSFRNFETPQLQTVTPPPQQQLQQQRSSIIGQRRQVPRLNIRDSSNPTVLKKWIEETLKSPTVQQALNHVSNSSPSTEKIIEQQIPSTNNNSSDNNKCNCNNNSSDSNSNSDNSKSIKSVVEQNQQIQYRTSNFPYKVKLDVGGKHFSTTVSTLTKHPESMLAAMFSQRFELPIDQDGRIFIDRDGKLFSHILAYLRDGPIWSPPTNFELRKRLEIEFQYYGLTGPLAPLGLVSPVATPRCVCTVQHLTLGQEAHHQGAWDELADFAPGIKSFRMLVSSDSRIYAITERTMLNGSANGGTPQTIFQFEEYNPVYNNWTLKGPILESMNSYYLVSAVVGDTIYAIPDAGLKQPVFCFERAESRWRMLDTQLPTGKTAFSLVALDEYLYVIGGYQGSKPAEFVDRYHPRTNAWCQVAAMTTKKSAECSAVAVDDSIVVVGANGATVERYHTHANSWSLVQSGNNRFNISSVAVLDGRIYAIGSENEYEGINLVLQYNWSTNEWRRVAPIVYNAYYSTSALVVDRYIYFVPWTGATIVKRYESCTIYD
ncbi:Kelch repeat-containing protein [Heterostelium album PN500]|uniref:Kelch repeat-containing protein n=1 Tax=Heterostelium pallidum (strain ATCC 26659 / Pp 5 / PN500) TaxID=670386 RepID=D3BSC8_HETP5|nr:Kelch repeat-containing protein [Heterostelium album PN500]EFA75701.1 Kelch repeat-containing protein [Heterostelium album PN500]|eukprot:XP_020427835.1 Kelch repeat-containing protein [Heterostelium album PN500]